MIEVDQGLHVNSTIHAAERARTRVPRLHGWSRDQASMWVERTAGRALRDGRKSLRCPRWCIRDYESGYRRRGKATRDGTARFVWDEDETVAMLVRRATAPPGEQLWVVQTVLVP